MHRKKSEVLISGCHISLHLSHCFFCFFFLPLLLCKTYMFNREKLENVNKQ